MLAPSRAQSGDANAILEVLMARKRFLDSIARTARSERPAMPYARGQNRAKMIARRVSLQPKKAVSAR